MPTPNRIQTLLKTSFLVMLFSLFSCENNRLNIDVSDKSIELNYFRLDKELSQAKPEDIPETHFKLAEKYSAIYQLFVEDMLREGPVYDKQTAQRMRAFVEHPDIKEIFAEINASFPEKEFLNSEFSSAFAHYLYYFPDAKLPNILGYYSNFNAKALYEDSILAVGLEMYLGKEHQIIKRIPNSSLPQYIKNKMERDYLVSDAMKIFLLKHHYKDIGQDFLSTIVSMGKIMYLLEATMPNTENWKLMTYTKEELNWCEANEEQLWAFIIEKDMLFSTNQETINNFIDEGPFTKGLPNGAPARVGIWIGWQMVRDYMNNNEKISLQEMLNEEDAKQILKHYKP